MRTDKPLSSCWRATLFASALGLFVAPLPAFSELPEADYATPDHSLAASDSVGRALFDRDTQKVVLPPRFVQKRHPAVAEREPNELPSWPAKWAPPLED